MVTYSDLFQFGALNIAIITLVIVAIKFLLDIIDKTKKK